MNTNHGITTRTRIATVALTCALAGAGLGLATASPAWADDNTSEGTVESTIESTDSSQDETPALTAGLSYFLSSTPYTDAEGNEVLYSSVAAQENLTAVTYQVTNNTADGSALAAQINGTFAAIYGEDAFLTIDPELTAAAYQRAGECALLTTDFRPNGTFFTSVNERAVAEVLITAPASTTAEQAVAALSNEQREYLNTALAVEGLNGMGCASVTVGDTTYWIVLLTTAVNTEGEAAVADGEVTFGCSVATSTLFPQGGATVQLDTVGATATLDLTAAASGTTTCGALNLQLNGTTVSPSVSWSSSDENTVTVGNDENGKGVVTAVATGSAVVATTLNGYPVSYTVTVGDGKSADAIDLNNCTISGVTYQTWTGAQITPVFSVIAPDNITTVPETSYTVTYGENTEVGTGTVTITAKEDAQNVTGSKTVEFQIVAATTAVPEVAGAMIDSALTTLRDAGFTAVEVEGELANAEAGTTAYQVYAIDPVAGTQLEAGATVSVYFYADPNAELAGIPEALDPEEGENPVDENAGSEEPAPAEESEATATSLPDAIADGSVTVAAIASQTYTGGEITPVPTVMAGETALVAGTDYTLAYSNNVNAGQATVTITGIGAYQGSYAIDFTIAARSITSFAIASVATQTYTGQALTPAISVSDGTTTLVAGTDFSVYYEQNVNAGTGHIVVTGAGNYCDSIDGTFVIAPVNISQATVVMPNAAYTGQPLTPVPVSVTIGDLSLTNDVDYTVVGYTANTNVGDAKATLQGKGNFTGTVVANWKVVSQGTASAGTTQTLPKTGDTTNIVPIVVGCVVGVALVVAAIVLIVRSRSSKRSGR